MCLVLKYGASVCLLTTYIGIANTIKNHHHQIIFIYHHSKMYRLLYILVCDFTYISWVAATPRIPEKSLYLATVPSHGQGSPGKISAYGFVPRGNESISSIRTTVPKKELTKNHRSDQ
jgi:hypothetical protein